MIRVQFYDQNKKRLAQNWLDYLPQKNDFVWLQVDPEMPLSSYLVLNVAHWVWSETIGGAHVPHHIAVCECRVHGSALDVHDFLAPHEQPEPPVDKPADKPGRRRPRQS